MIDVKIAPIAVLFASLLSVGDASADPTPTTSIAGAIGVILPDAAKGATRELKLDIRQFRVIPSESGSVDYYRMHESPTGPFIRGTYNPPLETVLLGRDIPETYRHRVSTLRWRWRAVTLPNGGDECAWGKGDSAAVVYVTWKRGLRWYALKYVWSAVGPLGKTCDQKRNPFRAQDTVILRSGGPLNDWQTAEIHPDAEFRAHFENGDPHADVPELIGVGLMSDGDQTGSVSSADYADFAIDVR